MLMPLCAVSILGCKFYIILQCVRMTKRMWW